MDTPRNSKPRPIPSRPLLTLIVLPIIIPLILIIPLTPILTTATAMDMDTGLTMLPGRFTVGSTAAGEAITAATLTTTTAAMAVMDTATMAMDIPTQSTTALQPLFVAGSMAGAAPQSVPARLTAADRLQLVALPPQE